MDSREEEYALAAETRWLDSFIRTRSYAAYAAFSVSILAELYVLLIKQNMLALVLVFMAAGIGLHCMNAVSDTIRAKDRLGHQDNSSSPVIVTAGYIGLAFLIFWLCT